MMSELTNSPSSPVVSRLSSANRAVRRARMKMELMAPSFDEGAMDVKEDAAAIMPSIVEEEEEEEEEEEQQAVPRAMQFRGPQHYGVVPRSPHTGDKRHGSACRSPSSSRTGAESDGLDALRPNRFKAARHQLIQIQVCEEDLDRADFRSNSGAEEMEEASIEAYAEGGDLESLLAAARLHMPERNSHRSRSPLSM